MDVSAERSLMQQCGWACATLFFYFEPERFLGCFLSGGDAAVELLPTAGQEIASHL